MSSDYLAFNLTYSFSVANEFSAGNVYTVNTAFTGQAAAAAKKAANIINKYASSSDINKLQGYKKEICDLVSYNDDAVSDDVDYGNPWQLIWVFDGDPSTNVVCEGYSKAFKYLCDKTSFITPVYAYTMTGWMDGGLHMWNMVEVDDKYYHVDVTNCDGNAIGIPDKLFLKGVSNPTSSSFEILGITYTYDSDSISIYGSKLASLSTSDLNSIEPKPLDPNLVNFVDRLYYILLNRNADPSGLTNWVNQLANGTATSADIVFNIAGSPEFTNKNLSNGEIVERMYYAMLGRSPDPAGHAGWTDRLDVGMSIKAIINGFAGSQEFAAICQNYGIQAGAVSGLYERDKNYYATAFISRCYTKALGRCGDIGGIENWVGYLNRGEQSPAQIAFGFVFSSEMQNKNLTDYQYVEMLYELCFNRTGDPGGINNWLNHLANGASRQDVFNGFINSQEFANTVASFGL